MANDFDDEFLPDESTPADTAPKGDEGASKPETPAAPKHSPLALAMARELGIEPEGHTPESLQATITAVRRHTAPKPAEPLPEQDEPIDYGTTLEGKPITSEAEFLAEYNPAQLRSLKLAHQAVVENKKLRKQNEAIQKRLDDEARDRRSRALLREVHKTMKERKDLYGENPGQAAPGTPEAHKYQMTIAHLQSLQQITTPADDTRAAMELFGPAPQEKKPAKGPPTREDYIRAQLQRPSQRRPTDNRTAREKRVEQVAAEMAEANGYLGSDDDDADLLD